MSEILWQPHPGPQTEVLQRSEDEILYGGSRGGGKDVHKYAKVLTSDGWKLAKDITFNDKLITVSGKETSLIGIYPKKDREMYTITFDDGASVICDKEHRWLTYSASHGYRDGWKIKTVEEILSSKDRYAIPLMENGYDGQYLPSYDPYILGLIVGDGCMTGEYPTVYTPDEQIKDYLVDRGWNVFIRKDKVNTLYQLSLSSKKRYPIYDELPKSVGVNKYIPEKLLDMSSENRLALLQGLLDSDGSCEKTGSVRFSTVSEQLAKDVQYLVRSLGGKASIAKQKPRITGYSSKESIEYRVSIGHCGKFAPFRLEKKAIRVKQEVQKNKRYIKSIEYYGIDDGVCFAIDDPSHLYVVQDFIVTHNTDAGIVWLVEPQYIANSQYRALVLRLNATDLTDWIDRATRMYQHMGVTVKGNPAEFIFPSGARIKTGHLGDETAFNKYKGHEYQKILIEELTQIPSESRYLKLKGSCRSTIPGLKAQIMNTTNPDGDGHLWVKRRFIENKPKGRTYFDKYGGTRVFIASSVEDNPTLYGDGQSDYLKYLESLKDDDPELYQQWRYGDWTSFQLKGSIYGDILEEMYEQGRILRFNIEPNALVNGLWDLGYDDAMAIWLYQQIGQEIRFVGYYENSNEPFSHYYDVLNQLSQKHKFRLGVQYVPHDAKVHELSTGYTRLDTLKSLFGENNVAVNVPKGSPVPAIIDGIEAVKRILRTSYFHEEFCEEGIEKLRMYRRKWNEKLGVYSKEPIHDEFSHCADAIRTACTILVPGSFSTTIKKIYTPEQIATLSQMEYYRRNPKELKKLIRQSI